MAKHFKICSREEFRAGNTVKTVWRDVGRLIETDRGGMMVKMNHLPGIIFSAFPIEDKENASPGRSSGDQPPPPTDEDYRGSRNSASTPPASFGNVTSIPEDEDVPF